MTTRIAVTHKGETGYLHTEITLDLRTHYSVTLDPARADTFASLAQAHRHRARVAGRFDRVEITTDE